MRLLKNLRAIMPLLAHQVMTILRRRVRTALLHR